MLRRHALQAMIATPALSACIDPPQLRAARSQAPLGKFAGMSAGLSAGGVQKVMAAQFFREGENHPFFSSGALGSDRIFQVGQGFGNVPDRARVIWRSGVNRTETPEGRTVFSDPIIGDYTVDLAASVPDNVLAEIKRLRQGFNFKFLVTPNGVCIGWDSGFRPIAPVLIDGKIMPGSFTHKVAITHVGGDLMESTPFEWMDASECPECLELSRRLLKNNSHLIRGYVNMPVSGDRYDGGKLPEFMTKRGLTLSLGHDPTNGGMLWRLGWYIDPKTKVKIPMNTAGRPASEG
jgi:hypothetical protein